MNPETPIAAAQTEGKASNGANLDLNEIRMIQESGGFFPATFGEARGFFFEKPEQRKGI